MQHGRKRNIFVLSFDSDFCLIPPFIHRLFLLFLLPHSAPIPLCLFLSFCPSPPLSSPRLFFPSALTSPHSLFHLLISLSVTFHLFLSLPISVFVLVSPASRTRIQVCAQNNLATLFLTPEPHLINEGQIQGKGMQRERDG